MIDITGMKFNRWTVIKEVKNPINKSKKKYWLCECDCGSIKEVQSYNIRNGFSKSCGCLLKEIVSKKNSSHLGTKYDKKLYNKYQDIKSRCYNQKRAKYKSYGGRGIKMCEEWKKDFSIFQKWAYNNGYEEHLTIERIDVNGNYEPSNCRWIPMNEQAKNKTTNVNIEINGEINCIAEWGRKLGFNQKELNKIYRAKRKNKDFKKILINIAKEKGAI